MHNQISGHPVQIHPPRSETECTCWHIISSLIGLYICGMKQKETLYINRLSGRIAIIGIFLLWCVLSGSAVFSQAYWQTQFEQSGGEETSRYEATRGFSQMLADSSAMVSFQEYGTSPQGRSLFALVLDKDGLSDPLAIKETGRVVFFILACLHPGEPDGKDAGLIFFRDIAIYRQHQNLLNHISYIFVPIANPDGHERFGPYHRINQNGPKEMGWRTTANNLNMNRDFVKLDAPETAYLVSLLNQWLPDFFMDIHTTNGGDYQYVVTYAVEDMGSLDPGITRWIQNDYLPVVKREMEEVGFPIFPYVAFRQWHDPRSGLRTGVSTARYSVGYAGTRNRAGILVETHMLKPYDLRVQGSKELIIKTAVALDRDHEKLRELNSKADQLCRSGTLRKEMFPLTYRLTEKSIPIDFHGFRYRVETSDLTGLERVIYSDTPEVITMDWYRFNEPQLTIVPPQFYVIPAQWNDVIDRLATHGIEMITLTHDTTMELDTWLLKDVRFAATPFEGRHRLAGFEKEPVKRTFNLTRGAVIIPTDQQAARLIIHALEPASTESFLQWGFFNAVFERKEYAEAYIMDIIAREMIKNDPALLEEFNRFKESIESEGSMKMWELYFWFYSRSPWWDEWKDVYPVGAIRGE